jgi:hypothetical protein
LKTPRKRCTGPASEGGGLSPVSRGLHTALLITVCFLILLGGCTARLVADYDPVIDKSLTDLSVKTENHFNRLQENFGTDKADFDSNRRFYDEFEVEVNTLIARAKIHPRNEITIEQLGLLRESMAGFEELHRQDLGTMERDAALAAIGIARSTIKQHFEAIWKLEFEKKNVRRNLNRDEQ